jgi:hypothetical protein
MWRAGVALACALALTACAPAARPLPAYHGDPQVRGSVARVEPIGAYAAWQMRALLWAAKVPAPVATGVRLYRVSYWSTTDGKPVLVSGLLGVPGTRTVRGTVLWMHGTHTTRKDSISEPGGPETRPAAFVFAGGGYLLMAPDLVGLGVSRGPQAYFVNASTIAVTEDLARAAQRVAHDLGLAWNPDLYIAGFSNGGHATAILEHELARRPDPALRVRAAAAIAGVYDLADTTLPFALQGRAASDPAYLSNVALAYSTYYRQPLESVMTPRGAALARSLLDGDHDIASLAELGTDPKALFRPQFLADVDRHGSDWFLDAMRANQAGPWAPKVPFRAYYGDKDVDAPPQDARAFTAEARRLGGDAQAIDVGPYDHGGSALKAAPEVRRWFDALSAARVGANVSG